MDLVEAKSPVLKCHLTCIKLRIYGSREQIKYGLISSWSYCSPSMLTHPLKIEMSLSLVSRAVYFPSCKVLQLYDFIDSII